MAAIKYYADFKNAYVNSAGKKSIDKQVVAVPQQGSSSVKRISKIAGGFDDGGLEMER